jgi:hypothetical protein
VTFSTNCPSGAATQITLGSTLTVNTNITIDGTGHVIVVDGGGTVTVFTVTAGTAVQPVTLDALTVQHGNTGNDGGGIDNGGTLSVTNGTFSGNSAFEGGGIYNTGTLSVTNSTFSGNSTGGGGGGIFNNGGTLTVTNSTLSANSASLNGGGIANGGTLTVTNSTFAGNSANNGGGIDNGGGTLTVTNSTVTGNSAGSGGSGGGIYNGVGTTTLTNTLLTADTANNSGANCSNVGGTLTDGGHNLEFNPTNTCGFSAGNGDLFTDPLLAPLGNYGGTTQTVALLPGSPAIDAGAAVGGSVQNTDQRGITRPQLGGVDIGAFESQGFTMSVTGGGTQSAFPGTAFGSPLAVSVTSSHSEPVSGGVVAYTVNPVSGAGATLSAATATLNGSGAASVTATANGTAGAYTVTASASGATPNGAFTLTNLAVPTITLSPMTLPNGVKGVAYPSQTLSATGGTAPYTFTLTAGSLPSGLTLSTAGVLSGTPTATGPFTFTVAATDNSAGHFTGTQQYMVTVSAAALVSIAVMPANGTLKVGQTQQYTATGTYQDGTTPVLPAVQVTWTSDTPGVASVNASGEVTATAGGTAHITATVGSVSGQTMVTVSTPTLGGVSVPPAPSGRPSGTTSAPGATPAPAPSAPPHGGTTGSEPAPGPLPTER